MKPELDKEIDALLRSSARGGMSDASASDRRDARAPHLDADELAAFAENALTDAPRARFVAHLADCDDCRRTATRLALAANVAPVRDERETVAAGATEKGSATEKINASPSSHSWREAVAAIFAPRAWRYAMPVVALLCVGVVVLVVMRRVPTDSMQRARNNDEAGRANITTSVAQSENHATAEESANTSSQTQDNVANTPVAGSEVSSEDARQRVGKSEQQAATQPAKNASGGAPSNAVGGAAGATNNSADVATRRVDDLQAAPPVAASAPVSRPVPQQSTQSTQSLAPQATPVPVNEDRAEIANAEKMKQAGQRESEQARQTRAQSRVELGRVDPNDQRAANRSASRNEPAGSAGAATKSAPKREAREDKKKDDDELSDSSSAKGFSSETRTVAGRRFRRAGDAWIDTAYRSNEATTVVRRGSEQYRALIADEPEIARVANALGGEVVVVWKGRAYRIR
jgi:hypothetical protein